MARLRQISTFPTSGIVAFDQASTTFIRYIERATGHIYETISNRADVKKISVQTIPKVYEALWAADGSKLIFRYTKDGSETIKSVAAKISTSSTPESAIEAIFLPDDLRTISIFGNKIFYFTDTSSGATGMTANIDGSSKLSTYVSSFADWISKWTSTNVVTIYSRPSGSVPGVAYTLNPATGAYVKIVGNLNGLGALGNSDGTLVLLSYTDSNVPKLAAYDIKLAQISQLEVPTLVDKCVWSTKEKNIVYCAAPTLVTPAIYPDDWYKGKISFNDSLWKINASTGETKELINLTQESGIQFDAVDLGFNQNENVLVFRNKNNLTSWRYELVK
jgi:hypothetical protein